jgi:hypothetical protein
MRAMAGTAWLPAVKGSISLLGDKQIQMPRT